MKKEIYAPLGDIYETAPGQFVTGCGFFPFSKEEIVNEPLPEVKISIEEAAAPSEGLKIFDRSCGWNDKVNFVDSENAVLGYDLSTQCCEDADWFIADTISEKVLDNKILDNPENYLFDKSFFCEFGGDDTYMAVFKIVSSTGAKYIHLHNTHNGYYSHGFTFNRGRAYELREGSL